MKNYYFKLVQFIQDLFQVSKIIKIKKKKLKILFIAVINNLLVVLDVLIILYFSDLLSNKTSFDNALLLSVIELTYLLPLFILLRFYLIYIEKVFITKFQQQIEKSLKSDLLYKVFDRGNFSIADAYFYVNELSRQVSSFYSIFSIFLGSFVQIVAFTIYLSISNLEIVLVFILGGLLLFVPTITLTKLGRKYAHISYTQQQELSNEIEKVLENMFLIKIVKKVNQEIKSFSNNLDIYFDARLKDIKAGTLNSLLPNFLTTFFLSLFIVLFNFSKFITLDFIAILLRLFQSLGNLNKNLHLVSSFHVYLDKFYNLENQALSVENKNKITINNNLDNAIEFKNVQFRYFNSNENTFENLNLNIKKDKHTILTGPNGSGKSTLLGLATGILIPNSGNVFSFSEKMGYVSSTPLIIKGSLRENVLYGNGQKINDEKILDLISKFKLFEKVNKLDLEKQISNKTLSMGQMQKISFIRALLGDKEILILDESTANLDVSTQTFINKILSELNLTILNSTHSATDEMRFDHHIHIQTFDDIKKVKVIK